MKLVVGKPDRRVLGVHIVGDGAAEMIQLAAIAVKMGATKEDFDRTVAVHPDGGGGAGDFQGTCAIYLNHCGDSPI